PRGAGEGAASVTDAVSELITPLVSSTLTPLVVFAPLGLLSGVPGQFFRALSQSLSAAVLLSLVLSITVVPLLARWAFREHHVQEKAHQEGRLDRWYLLRLGTMMRHPALAVGIAVILAVVTGALFMTI